MKESSFFSTDFDPAKDTNQDHLKEQVLQLIRDELVKDKQLRDDAVATVLNDYADMKADAFLKQLHTFCRILNALKQEVVFQKMLSFLANLLRAGIHKVDRQALDAVTIRRDALEVSIDGKSTIIGPVNAEFLTILSLGKESRETERQLMVIDELVKHRNDDNLQAVARAFKIPVHKTKQTTLLIEKLFDNQGNFIRRTFEPMCDALAMHGNQAFELLWCYFKALKGRANRVSFLNALQHLINRINRPKHALRFLMSDFCRYPDRVDPSDRNAIMLANILLRTYNKELDVDIEMTPEEVLNVYNGLDPDVVRYAQFRIDSVEYRFAAKVRHIRERMTALLKSPGPSHQYPTVRHLLFLEREIFIFLALLSGRTARLILVSALTEYGDPKAEIYGYPKAAAYLPVFLQHLKIIVRGVGRVGTRDDVSLLRKISKHGSQLSEISGTQENQRSVVRTLQVIDNVIRSITSTKW